MRCAGLTANARAKRQSSCHDTTSHPKKVRAYLRRCRSGSTKIRTLCARRGRPRSTRSAPSRCASAHSLLDEDASQGRRRNGVVRPHLESDTRPEHRRCARAARSDQGIGAGTRMVTPQDRPRERSERLVNKFFPLGFAGQIGRRSYPRFLHFHETKTHQGHRHSALFRAGTVSLVVAA